MEESIVYTLEKAENMILVCLKKAKSGYFQRSCCKQTEDIKAWENSM
jgi:hypothetical protein